MSLVEIAAAGWPFGLAFASSILGVRISESRRREALNRALHELRRPLQTLVLRSDDGLPDSFELVLGALDDLDREVNGGRRVLARRPCSCRAMIEQAVERWRGAAAHASRTLELRWEAGPCEVIADPRRIAQSLDNMIANALEHGGLRVAVSASLCPGGVRIVVSDSGRTDRPRIRPRDPRRGHGLEVAARVAAEHQGRFFFNHRDDGSIAILELPLYSSGSQPRSRPAPRAQPTPGAA